MQEVPGSIPGTALCAMSYAQRRSPKIIGTIDGQKCPDPGSNWGPPDLQSDALPTELSGLIDLSKLLREIGSFTHNAPRRHGPGVTCASDRSPGVIAWRSA